MKKSTIWLLTAVMAIAVLGLLFVQIMYMENMVKMRNEQFSEVVMRSLYNVASNLERDETKHFLDQDLNEAQRSLVPFSTSSTFADADMPAVLQRDSAGKSSFGSDRNTIGESTLPFGLNTNKSRQEILKGQYLYQKGLLNEVILNILNHASDRPITERADSVTVKQYIEQELQSNGLNMPFEFAVQYPSNSFAYSTSGYTEENKYNNYTRCQVYANEVTADVHPFFYEDEAKGLTLESMLAMTNDYDYRHGNGTLIDDMLKASGLFHVLVPFTLEERGDITMGFLVELPKRNGQMPFIDSFALTFYGDQDVAEVTGVKTIRNAQGTIQKADTAIYNLAGQRLLKLQKGINIVNGKKVVVK